MTRTATGRFAPGASGNPRGRPHNAESLAARVRALVDPDELVEYLLGVVRDPDVGHRDRLKAAELLACRGWGAPASSLTLDVTARQAPSLPAGWREMSPADRDRWLDSITAARLGGGE